MTVEIFHRGQRVASHVRGRDRGKKITQHEHRPKSVIPDKNKWTLIINKNVTAGAPYNRQNDVVRVPMEVGHLSDAQPFSVAFGRIAPKRCSIRIYYEKSGAWAEFDEK